MAGDMAEPFRVEREAHDWNRVEHLSGEDAADLEAEEAFRGREGERLRAVDHERPHTGGIEWSDLAYHLVGRGARDLEVGRVHAAQVEVPAVGTQNRVVGTCGPMDRATCRPAIRGGDNAPRARARHLARRHVDPTPVPADRHAVNSEPVRAVPKHTSAT